MVKVMLRTIPLTKIIIHNRMNVMMIVIITAITITTNENHIIIFIKINRDSIMSTRNICFGDGNDTNEMHLIYNWPLRR